MASGSFVIREVNSIFMRLFEYWCSVATDAAGQDEGESHADEDRRQPGEAAVREGQGCYDVLRPGKTGKLMQDAKRRYESSEADGQAHARARKADEFVEDGQHDDGDGKRIDEEQDRQGYLDDLVESEIGQQQADDADARGVFPVRDGGEFFIEEGRDSGDEADGGREAGQRDHDGQEPHADIAEEGKRRLGEYESTEVDVCVTVDLRRDGKVIAEQGKPEIE